MHRSKHDGYSITLSALQISLSGIVLPNSFARFRSSGKLFHSDNPNAT
jgi:hypothetical protein